MTRCMGRLSGGITYLARPDLFILEETSRELGQGAADSPLIWGKGVGDGNGCLRSLLGQEVGSIL